MIRAHLALPGYDQAHFDATPWFEHATVQAIHGLVRSEWSALAAQRVARDISLTDGYSRLADIIAYRVAHDTDPQGELHFMQAHIDPDDALNWLAAERPDIHAHLLREFGDEVSRPALRTPEWQTKDAEYLRAKGVPART
jgi:hypothetical protein